jgi:signal transduction histidine kinase
VRIPSFFHTTTFRLALLYAGLFCASFLLLFLAIYWTAEAIATAERRASITADLEGLRQVYEQSGGLMVGLVALGKALEERTEPDRVGDGLYLLAKPDLTPLAGNLTGWPAMQPADGPWQTFTFGRAMFGDPAPGTAEARHIVLQPGDFHLLVGRDARIEARFQQAITRAFVVSLAGMFALAAVGGLIMSRTILRRIDAINEGAERIMRGGGVRLRMPVRGRGDEFDRLAENLNRMLDEIERLLGSIRAVTNNIAHDLRSPLNRLRNKLEAALAEQPSEQRTETIERAIAEADGLLATFSALLSIADAEAGTSRGNLLPVDLAALGHDVAELYEPLVEEQGLVFETSIDGPATVSGNRQLLFQAIGNLIDNATKYGASGGRVSLAVKNGAGGPEVVVADRGPGIPPADRERVLERFVRLDASRSTPGNGLGLSLVAAIARLHDAVLRLDDNHPGLAVTLRFKPAHA